MLLPLHQSPKYTLVLRGFNHQPMFILKIGYGLTLTRKYKEKEILIQTVQSYLGV